MKYVMTVAVAALAVAVAVSITTADDAAAQCRGGTDVELMAAIQDLTDRVAYLEQRAGYSLAQHLEYQAYLEESARQEQERREREFDQETAGFGPNNPNPQGSPYYVRILNDTSATYGLGDVIHFEAMAPACPEATYFEDGDIDEHGGTTYLFLDGYYDGHQIAYDLCNIDLGERDGIATSYNISADHTMISGTFTIDESSVSLPNKYFIELEYDRVYEGIDSYGAHYSEVFTVR